MVHLRRRAAFHLLSLKTSRKVATFRFPLYEIDLTLLETKRSFFPGKTKFFLKLSNGAFDCLLIFQEKLKMRNKTVTWQTQNRM